MAITNNDISLILEGKTIDEQLLILSGISGVSDQANLVFKGVVGVEDELDILLFGKTHDELGITLNSKSGDLLAITLNAIEPPESLVKYRFFEDEITDFTITSGSLVNEITLNYAYDFVEGRPKAAITKRNPLSQLLYGVAKQTIDLMMVQHTRQAEKVADSILLTSSIPEIVCAFTHNLKSIFVEVGDMAGITHRAGIGENGYVDALGRIIRKRIAGSSIAYSITMKTTAGQLYRSELVTLTQISSIGAAGITITYEQGVATITIYADVAGSPPVEGAEVTISGVKKITDTRGQVRFNLQPGRYTAYITASGYEDAEITFTV
ncbi:MAG: carboxypeptidase-like regulatory domain-containing protein [Pseudomonadota bacterium]